MTSSSSDRFASEPITTWAGFEETVRHFHPDWLFRGHKCDGWRLTSSLERSAEQFGIPQTELPVLERQMLRDFRRQYADHDVALVRDDTLYCLALMQHFGAPTRLLDFTYSPFLAAFFALEKAKVNPPSIAAV